MVSKSEYFVQEFVLGFGFLSGLWIHVGIDPEDELFKALLSIINTLSPNQAPTMSFYFWLLPVIGLVVSIAGSYAMGGWLGLVAVGLAFIGGVFIGPIGILLVIIAVIIGGYAPSYKNQEHYGRAI